MHLPTALTIAGSDSGGGAGIQADLKAFSAVGVHGASAITCITAQNTARVARIDPLPVKTVLAQIDAVLDDLDVRAIKTGMLHNAAAARAIARRLDGTGLPLIVDPVLAATSGDALASDDLRGALADLAPLATLTTPNAHELDALTGRAVATHDDALAAGRALLDIGWSAVLVKGGHLDTVYVTDTLLTPEDITSLSHPRLEGPFHGAGCTLASLIAGLIARGHDLHSATRNATARLHRALARANAVGRGPCVPDALETGAPAAPEGARLEAAAWQIAAQLPDILVPEVGINIAWAPEHPDAVQDVLALTRRITRSAHGPTPPGPAARSASGHVARIVRAAMHADDRMRAAMNLAHNDATRDAAGRAGLHVVSFSRDDEPDEATSSVAWGTTAALKSANGRADVIADDGAPGKEAMMRLVAHTPEELVDKVARITRMLAGRDSRV